MKKIILSLLVCISSSFFCLKAQDIKSLFLAMPDSITPLLSEVNKADFIDFKASEMEAKVQNKFFKTSIMQELTADYICIQMTTNSTWQLKILPTKESYLIAIIETVGASLPDSRLTIYDAAWNRLDKNFLHPTIQLKDFIQPVYFRSKDITSSDLLALDIHTYAYRFDDKTLKLYVEFTGVKNLEQDLQNKIGDLIQSQLIYVWNADGFYKLND